MCYLSFGSKLLKGCYIGDSHRAIEGVYCKSLDYSSHGGANWGSDCGLLLAFRLHEINRMLLLFSGAQTATHTSLHVNRLKCARASTCRR